jgi:hypothetical protein
MLCKESMIGKLVKTKKSNRTWLVVSEGWEQVPGFGHTKRLTLKSGKFTVSARLDRDIR